jgi:hypothetical protein
MIWIWLDFARDLASWGLLAFVVFSYRPLHDQISNNRKTADTQYSELERSQKMLSARLTELTQRAERNTEALEHTLTANAALTTRTEQLERAAHHHAEMRQK